MLQLKRITSSKNFFLTLAFLGPIFIILGLYTFFYQKTILSFNRTPDSATSIGQKPKARKLVIKDVKIDLAVEEGQIIDGVWQISKNATSHLNTSANPGESGNVVIYGHNKKRIFGSLPFVKVGSKITIETEDGKKHEYEIIKKETVKPNNITYVMPTDYEVLTVYTCNGFLDTTRFVIQAKPI